MREIALLSILSITVLTAGTIIGLLFKGIDRKLAAWFQSRIGPPVIQPFYDMRKLMMKETIVPENSVKWIFKTAPLLALSGSALLLAYVCVPYLSLLAGIKTDYIHAGDLILIIYLIMIPSVAIIAGGFASGSSYTAVGSQREMVILMSIELPLAVTAIALAWRMSNIAPGEPAFSITTIALNPIWQNLGPLGIMGGIMLFLTILVIIPAEVTKVPFDQGEAETEIAEGLLAEYSGMYLCFYQISLALKILAINSLAVILFFPHGIEMLTGNHITVNGQDLTFIADIFLFLLKILLLFILSVTMIRVAMARFKISQVARLFIITLTLISLSGYLMIYLDCRITGM